MSDNLCEIRKELDEQMHNKCAKQWNEYEACGKRLEERGFPEGETCEGWYCDYLGCLDNHVRVPRFSLLLLDPIPNE